MSAIYDRFFKSTHSNRLIYNTCWEDPRADRAMLKLDSHSVVAMITSAGCNALDYLLDNPKAIHCIDVNSRQNALLELKIVALKQLTYADFFQLFGLGAHASFSELYNNVLRPELSTTSAEFWDAHQHYFSPKGIRKSLYFRGTSGDVAWSFGRGLRLLRPSLYKSLLSLLDSRSQIEQRALYQEIEPQLFGPVLRWLVRQPMLLTLLGVPRAQRDLINRQFPGGVSEYVKQKLRYVFTETDMRENYFWRVYLTGRYSPQCCPNYLKPESFQLLKQRCERIQLHHLTFEEFLLAQLEPITHYVLLDHQDWMATHYPAGLNSEWQAIFERAAPRCNMLLRSAALQVDFLPDFVAGRVAIDQALANKWHALDRVGTYGSTWFAKAHDYVQAAA